jgi:hypothetical protein
MMMLARTFTGGQVERETIELYAAALDDLTDEQLERACLIVVRTHTGGFIPPPAVLRKAIAPARAVVDADAILRRIEKLSIYNAATGMIAPPRAVVERELGEAVGYAYAAAGGKRLFADDEIGRDIATREFEKALAEAESRPGAYLPVIGGNGAAGVLDSPTIRRIGSGPNRESGDDQATP